MTYSIHHHAADLPLAKYVDSVIRSEKFQPVSQDKANIHLIIVTNRTSKRWLVEQNNSLSGRIVHILCTNIDVSSELLQPTFKTQWVDFRTGRDSILLMLRDQLTSMANANITYGLQVSPIAFDRFVIPRVVIAIGTCVALAAYLLITLSFYTQGSWIILLLGIVLVVYFTLLLLRKTSLPSFIYTMLRNRVAWFAASAESAEDAIGNNTTFASLSIPFYSLFMKRKK